MELSTVLRLECIEVNCTVADKDAALRAVARAAKRCSQLRDVDEPTLLEALRDREKVASTGVGKGVAIPHCRLEGLEGYVVGFLTVPDGVDFAAIDEEMARLIIFMVGPRGGPGEGHIRILSSVSQTLNQPGVVEALLAEHTAAGARARLLEYCRTHFKTTSQLSARNMFHVFVQDEDAFDEILQIFAGSSACSVAIVEAKNESSYLSRMPLFADFWSAGVQDFSRIIIAVVDGQMTNELVRRVEGVIAALNGKERVLLTVQNLFYATGALAI